MILSGRLNDPEMHFPCFVDINMHAYCRRLHDINVHVEAAWCKLKWGCSCLLTLSCILLSLCLYIYISLYLFLSVSLSFFHFLSLSLSIYLSIFISTSFFYLSLSFSLWIFFSLSQSIYLPLSSICPCLSPSAFFLSLSLSNSLPL